MRIKILIAAIVTIMIGLAFVLPAIAQWRAHGTLVFSQTLFLLLGCVVALGGVAGVIREVTARRA